MALASMFYCSSETATLSYLNVPTLLFSLLGYPINLLTENSLLWKYIY